MLPIIARGRTGTLPTMAREGVGTLATTARERPPLDVLMIRTPARDGPQAAHENATCGGEILRREEEAPHLPCEVHHTHMNVVYYRTMHTYEEWA